MFFEQLRKFAEKHGFEYEIADFNTNGEVFQFWMSRDDMEISISNPFDPTVFRVGFYDQYFKPPADRVTVNELVDDLKSFISEIPNVTITEEK